MKPLKMVAKHKEDFFPYPSPLPLLTMSTLNRPGKMGPPTDRGTTVTSGHTDGADLGPTTVLRKKKQPKMSAKKNFNRKRATVFAARSGRLPASCGQFGQRDVSSKQTRHGDNVPFLSFSFISFFFSSFYFG